MPARRAKPATAAYLERAAIAYLERFGGTTARLRRVLEKRVARSVEELGTDPCEGAQALEQVVEKLAGLGYVDDARFAASRVRSARARGKSARAVRTTLARQGLPASLIDRALADDPTSDLEAARAFVRRRRLGPHRPPEQREAERERDLAKLARAGFSYDVASRALSGEDA